MRWVFFLFMMTCVACGASVAIAGANDGELPFGVRITRLVVDKSDRQMEAYAGEDLVHVYRVGIGRGGLGPKGWEGDGITPEGHYTIDERHHSRDYHRFMHVSYPNREDRRRYRERREAGEIPEATGIGGAIGIHGTGGHDWVPRRFRRSAGCIVLDDTEAHELYRAIVPNAVIEIRE